MTTVGRHVPYVGKPPASTAGRRQAGAPDLRTWMFWQPHVCGVCCAAMALGGFRRAVPTLWSLIDDCHRQGVFRVEGDRVAGAFHHPMADFLNDRGVNATVQGALTWNTAWRHVAEGSLVMLSIDLSRLDNSTYNGGHLVLCHEAPDADTIVVHDPSAVLVPGRGRDVALARPKVETLSNAKGLVLSSESATCRRTVADVDPCTPAQRWP